MHMRTCTHTHTHIHTHTIVVDCIRKSLLIAEEVMKKYTCLKYILYIYFTYIYILLFSYASLYLQICIIHTRVLEKASHSCNQQSLDETIIFIWQEQELITQNSLVKVRDTFWDRLLYTVTEPPQITTQAGIAALCCHHIQHAIYSDCKETTWLIEIILCCSSRLNSKWPTSHHFHTF